MGLLLAPLPLTLGALRLSPSDPGRFGNAFRTFWGRPER